MADYLIFLIPVNNIASMLVNSKVDCCLQGEDLSISLHNAADHRETTYKCRKEVKQHYPLSFVLLLVLLKHHFVSLDSLLLCISDIKGCINYFKDIAACHSALVENKLNIQWWTEVEQMKVKRYQSQYQSAMPGWLNNRQVLTSYAEPVSFSSSQALT